jgi:rhodanese-related sulfurtransferase
MIVNVCYTGQTASFATAVINLVGQDEDYAGLEARNLKFGMCSITTDTSIIPEVDKWAIQIAEDEGYELETTSNTTDTTYDFSDPGTGETTLAGIIKANLDNAATDWTIEAVDVYASLDDYFIVNYWPEAEYIDPGHIPGAYQFTPKEDLNSDAKLNLLPTDETIVFYCYSGQTSAQVSAYLRLLGYDVKSLLYGVNGFSYESLSKIKYTSPTTDYTSIIE